MLRLVYSKGQFNKDVLIQSTWQSYVHFSGSMPLIHLEDGRLPGYRLNLFVSRPWVFQADPTG